MKKSSPKIIIGFEKKEKFTRDKFQIDKTIQILQMLQIYIYIYIYIVGGKRQINYQFIPTDLLRGCPLIRGFNENNLYHRLYTI